MTTNDDLHRLVDELLDSKIEVAARELRWLSSDGQEDERGMIAEDCAWMDSDLSHLSEFEPYDWGDAGPPAGRPVHYVPGVGLMIEDSPEIITLS